MMETIIGTYYLIGVGVISLLLLIEKPGLSWKWLRLPLLALMWPLLVYFVVRDGTYRSF
jgi:hypothetical protein